MKKHLSLCLITSSLLLSGCGFSPIYGTKGKGSTQVSTALNNIQINNIQGERGQFLRNKLIDRLYFKGRPIAPQAQLNINLTSFENKSGIQKDATATRSQLRMTANFTLRSINNKDELFKGQASTVASYSILDAQYGTLATQQDAYKRALIEIAEQITNRLSLFYAERAPFEKASIK